MGCHPCKHKVLVNNDNFLCYLCLQNYPEYMHFPCGHYGICEGCRLTLRNKDSIYRKKCPICKKKVNLIGIECLKCNKVFCIIHRYPEEHKCNTKKRKANIINNDIGGGKFKKIDKI